MTIRTGCAVLGSAALVVVGLTAQQVAQLPQPFATPSASNQSKSVPQPPGTQLKVPAGFTVSLFADNLQGPRTMIYAPNGDLFVAQSRAGSIVVLRGTNKDGKPDQRFDYATGLQNPFGLAFHEGYL